MAAGQAARVFRPPRNRRLSPHRWRIRAAFIWCQRLWGSGLPLGCVGPRDDYGDDAGTTSRHIVRATLESIEYQARELMDAMQADTGARVEELRVDGGASANNFLMQFQADILGTPIVRPFDVETTALGAAYLAGLAVGVWRGTEELESLWIRDRVFEPQMSESRRRSCIAGWRHAVRQARLSEESAAAGGS